MKKSRELNMSIPEVTDKIDVREISENFEIIDKILSANLVKRNTSTTEINVTAYPPYYIMKNTENNPIDYFDPIFEETFTLGPLEEKKFFINAPQSLYFTSDVQIEYDYFIPIQEAIASAIETLDVAAVSVGTAETIKSISETDGKIAVTKQSIAIKSNQVNGMTSYSKATSPSAIATSDSLNAAVGKLEYKIDTNETNISTLKKHVTGELTDSDFQEDSTAVMIKTVPTGMGNYAAVKMIGGKTVKTKNLLKPQNDLKEATVNGITFTPVFDSNGHLEYVTANGTATDTATFIVTKLTENISGYILSLGLSQESVSYGVACELGVSPWTTYQTIKGSGEKTVPPMTYTNTINVYVQVLKDAVANNVKFYPMLRKSGTSSIYEPYHEELWNAPVESVVSTSKNLFDEITELGDIAYATGGDVTSTTRIRTKNYIPVVGGSNLYIVAPNPINLFIYDSSKQYLGQTTGGLISNINNRATVLPNNARYVRAEFRDTYGTTYKNDIAFVTGTSGTYSPHFKTTLLVPSEVRNCVGYGLGLSDSVCNIVDFENGVYTQMLNEIDLGSLTWKVKDASRSLFSATLANSARYTDGAVIPSIITGKYTTVGYGTDWTNGMISMDGNSNVVCICDTAYASASDFKNAMNGQKLVYKLASTVVTDCSDILRPIRCETGGTITLQNEHSLDMPNTVVYKKEVSLS